MSVQIYKIRMFREIVFSYYLFVNIVKDTLVRFFFCSPVNILSASKALIDVTRDNTRRELARCMLGKQSDMTVVPLGPARLTQYINIFTPRVGFLNMTLPKDTSEGKLRAEDRNLEGHENFQANHRRRRKKKK